MNKRRTIFYVMLGSVFSLIIGALIFIYTIKLREVLQENILETVAETAQHDEAAINTCIGFLMAELQGVHKRMEAFASHSIQEMEIRLNLESSTTSFNQLFMLAADGTIYTSKFVVYNQHNMPLGRSFDFLRLVHDSDKDEFVVRFDDKAEFAGIARESLLYGLRLKDFRIDGHEMIALLGTTSIRFLQDHLIIESFVIRGVPHGFCSVINRDGDYVVGNRKSIYLDDSINIFDALEKGSTSIPVEEIRLKMAELKTLSFYHSTGSDKKLLYMEPFASRNIGLDWYLVMAVDIGILEERQTKLSFMSLSLLGVVVFMFIAIMFYIIFTNKKLYKANEAVMVRSEFLSSMSHEIRTPLNGIIGLNYLISTHVENSSRIEQIKDWLNKSKSLANYLLGLLNDILDMSKLQSGHIDIIATPFSVDSLMDDICFMHSGNAEKNGLQLELAKDLVAPWVMGDITRIKQVLTNIIGNAIKFTPRGGKITIECHQELVSPKEVKNIFICADTGRGMSAEFLQHIFDPFTQEGNRHEEATLKGTGLGMPICNELVMAMNGHIKVESTLGKGSRFEIVIPLDIVDAPIEILDKEVNRDLTLATDAASASSLNILLAEDAEFNAEFLMEVLKDEGFSVTHAENGQAVLDIFKNSRAGEFDIILMDMQMPVMDGCEAAMAIRSLDRPDAKTVSIYACTANTFKEDMDRAMASGMDDFLTKPIDIKVFLQKMAMRNLNKICGTKNGNGN